MERSFRRISACKRLLLYKIFGLIVDARQLKADLFTILDRFVEQAAKLENL